MKATFDLLGIRDQEVIIHFVRKSPSGYGHYKIDIELEYFGNVKAFVHTTSDMPAIDETSEMEYEERQLKLFDIARPFITERVVEWVLSIDENA